MSNLVEYKVEKEENPWRLSHPWKLTVWWQGNFFIRENYRTRKQALEIMAENPFNPIRIF